MAARSFPEMAEYRQTMNPRLFPVSYDTRSSRTNYNNCAPRIRCTALRTAALLYCCKYCCTVVLLYVLLHCCTAVCSKGLVGGWVEGALRRPWWVDGPFRTWESFFVLWEMNLVFFFFPVILPASLVLGSTTVPTAALP